MKRRIVSFLIIFWIASFFAPRGSAQTPVKQRPVYPVVAEDGAWCWFTDPRAVYHKGLQERIYFGYINSKGDVVISARDVKTKAIQTHVLHAKLQIDDHNVPSILFLPDGKILTFYTEHSGRIFMRKSKNAEDISEWEEEKILSFGLAGNKRLCYSHPVMLSGENNRIYMFYRGQTVGEAYPGWRQYISYSDNLGDSWSEGQSYLDTKAINNAIYLKVSSDNKSRIDFVFTDGHPKIGPASVYHMYYEKGKFSQTNGDEIADIKNVPLNLNKVNKVYDVTATNVKSWIWDIALDKNRRPVIAYTQYPEETDHRYHYTRWNGKNWMDQEICKAGGMITVIETGKKVLEAHYSGGIVLDHNNPSNVYLSRQINGVFEIEQWKLKRGNWKVNKITDKSAESNIRPYVIANYTGKEPMVLWMNGLYNHYTKFKTALMINEAR
ncbi:BNR-4 repeat-containing protein [Pedobacter heparinus]|uniref:BNR-4 repeat-containing protein n=1 Tax=Pedobacter heparinus TaxID=984 RepID=UPI00292FA6DA|nr:BNR-4 repeat-containing protein [Pedobacter heparinus]